MDRLNLFLARRYAQAYLDVYYTQLEPANIPAFQQACLFFKTHQPACFLMNLTLLDFNSKKKALLALVDRFALPASCYDLMALVVAHHRAPLLSLVFYQLTDLYQKRAGLMNFSIQSSAALDQEEKKYIEQFLEEQVRVKVYCSYELCPELIAGVRIFNEQYLWEYSVQAQLRALYTSVRR